MAVQENISSNTARLRLNYGTTSSGAVRTLNQSIGTLGEPTTWDAGKAYAIADAMGAVLSHDIYDIQRTAVFTLVDE